MGEPEARPTINNGVRDSRACAPSFRVGGCELGFGNLVRILEERVRVRSFGVCPQARGLSGILTNMLGVVRTEVVVRPWIRGVRIVLMQIADGLDTAAAVTHGMATTHGLAAPTR